MADKLKEYKKKRDFGKTAEPEGKAERADGKRRRKFVVQYHEASRDHYDFRLEYDGVLLSWAVPKGPSFHPDDKRLAIRVEDHPSDYVSFEGTIPKGQYGGGTVMLWDEGTYEPVGDFAAGLKKGALKFELFGERLGGIWNLVRSARGEKQETWFLIKHPDAFARGDAGIGDFTTSVTTGRTADEIARGEKSRKVSAKGGKGGKSSSKRGHNPFDRAPVQPVTSIGSIPEGDDRLFEVKYDGMRALSFTENGRTKLISRNENDLTPRFAGVAKAVGELIGARAAVLDGELAVADERGRTDFQKLQRHLRGGTEKPCYMVFDVLALDGEDLRGLPIERRKEILHGLLNGANAVGRESGVIRESGYVVGRGRESFDAVQKLGLEGIVGKRLGSAYGESGAWIKIKCVMRQEFVVGGWSANDGRVMSSLLLGVYDGGEFVYSGRVGTGFSEKDRADIAAELQKIVVKKCPFVSEPKPKSGEKLFWTDPETLIEAAFAEWTDDGVLRHARFLDFRTDKDPREVVREDRTRLEAAGKTEESPTRRKETVGAGAAPAGKTEEASLRGEKTDAVTVATPKAATKGARSAGDVVCGVKITHPEREAGAGTGVSKLAVAKYYERAAERMLAYIGGRVLSVVRCHGDGKPCFFKKHPSGERSGVIPVDVGGEEDYFYIDSAEGLIAEVQAGSVEFHAWGSRADEPDRPDTMVFDLDPDEGVDIERVRRGALDLRAVLDELSLTSFLKTSGGKGYHIVVPFAPSAGWEEFKDFARGVAEVMAARWPARYTANSRKAARAGKIYIDWMRNGRGATSVAPYSLRARAGGGVSVPIAWEEIGKIAPDGIDTAGALKRLAAPDPWQDYFKVKQSLGVKSGSPSNAPIRGGRG